ncbi:MAG: DUF1302 domain-containing protein [Gammaproteobacteria bacterium]|nr:DUF1302 domain-containing protein [Gammaproteobacteria bacterium]
MKPPYVFLPVLVLFCGGIGAEPLSELDESGFEDTYSENLDVKESDFSTHRESNKKIDTSAYLSIQGAYNYAQSSNLDLSPGDSPMDFTGLSRSKVKAGVTIDVKHNKNWRSKLEAIAWYDASWKINDEENYTSDVLDTYKAFTDFREVYVEGALTPNLDFRFGRQLIVWGKSDSIRITDVINPLDNRNPGMVDIKDLRLTTAITKLDYYFGSWTISGMVIHEPRLEIEAPFGSDYRPSNAFGTPIPYARFPDRIEPEWGLDNNQYAVSLEGHFSGWDLSYYAAHVYNHQFSIKTVNNLPIRFYDISNMLGVAGNVVSGPWLFKAESAFNAGINYRSTSDKNRLDMLIGFDYMGLSDTILSFEIANRHIFGYESKMLNMTLQQASAKNTFPDFVRKNSLSMALRSSYSFDHSNATITYLLFLNGGSLFRSDFDGGFQRLWIDYHYSDSITLNSGFIDYISRRSPVPFYQAIENNDRFFTEVQFSF